MSFLFAKFIVPYRKMKVDTYKSVSVYFFRSKIREKGGKEMGKKGTPHRKWSKEEKRKISGQFSMPSHGGKPLWLLQAAATARENEPL